MSQPFSPNKPEEKPGGFKSAEASSNSEDSSLELGDSGVSQVIEGVDGGADGQEAVSVNAEVSEKLGESSEQSKGGQGTKSQQDDNAAATGQSSAQIKAHLLKNLPTEKEMKAQIEKEIKKEIRHLHKKALKMLASSGEVNYFEMNNLVKKIRELKGILAILAKASVERLKTLWLRFVHGVM